VPGGVADQDRETCILTADWTIDLAPKDGVKGGEIVAESVPETAAKAKGSFMGNISRRC
jgi:excinuclease UvrABC ATPase subunit